MNFTPFTYLNTEKAALYRAIMQVFVAAKQRFLVHLRPEDIVEDILWEPPPERETVRNALDQLVDWGNLQAHPDTGRVTSVEDFYRARYLYQLSREGEAVETALRAYTEALQHQAALQSVALVDIRTLLQSLRLVAAEAEPDAARAHVLLRELMQVFADLADNAQAFMTGLGRSLDLRSAEREAFLAYKERLIDYLERFIGDLVTASADIAGLLQQLDEDWTDGRDRLLLLAAQREASDAAPDPENPAGSRALDDYLAHWQIRWQGLQGWFLGDREHPSQAMLLRNRARKAITDLLEAVVRLNERRLGRSDRSADFRALARWFAEAPDDAAAHRLWRAAFGLTPARHLGIDQETLQQHQEQPPAANESWLNTQPLAISPRLRATGSLQKRAPPASVKTRDQERALLARQLAEETQQTRAARERLLAVGASRLSELGELDRDSFALFLHLLGDALAAMRERNQAVAVTSGDGALRIELAPLKPAVQAFVHSPDGVFGGRDYCLRIVDLEQAEEPVRVPKVALT